MITTADKIKLWLATAVEVAWANKPYVVAVVSGVVVFMQAAGYSIPAWLYGTCAVLGCAALHSSVKAR